MTKQEFNEMVRKNELLNYATLSQVEYVYDIYAECVEKINCKEADQRWWKYYDQFVAVLHILSINKTYDEVEKALWETIIIKEEEHEESE